LSLPTRLYTQTGTEIESYSASDNSQSQSQSPPTSSSSSESSSSSSSISKKEESIQILIQLASQEDSSTNNKLTTEQAILYKEALSNLPPPPPNSSLDVDGAWELLAIISPDAEKGNTVDFFSKNSWKEYIQGTGPSPFQSLATGSSRIRGLTQNLTPTRFVNVLEFALPSLIPFLGGTSVNLALIASLEETKNNQKIFRFRRGFFLLKDVLWEGSISIPYPVPFDLLGKKAMGWLDTIGYDEPTGFRSAMGNKGTTFIFQKIDTNNNNNDNNTTIVHDTVIDDIVNLLPENVRKADQAILTKLQHETLKEEQSRNEGLTKRPIILCPQQFGGKPGDYTQFISLLRQKGHPIYLVRLSIFQWLSLLKSAFTKEYFQGTLEPSKTLPFYLNAISETVQRMDDATNDDGGDDVNYSILSHSIGGWVARAWLGEIATPSQRERCRRFVSLGTPHASPPPDSILSQLDQSRGLLGYINSKWPGAYFDTIDYTCVASQRVTGKLFFTTGKEDDDKMSSSSSSSSSSLDAFLAYASYLALVGKGNIEGDGITPVQAAMLEGAKEIVLEDVYHADVLPNPIGFTNVQLMDGKWYADSLGEWVDAL